MKVNTSLNQLENELKVLFKMASFLDVFFLLLFFQRYTLVTLRQLPSTIMPSIIKYKLLSSV